MTRMTKAGIDPVINNDGVSTIAKLGGRLGSAWCVDTVHCGATVGCRRGGVKGS